MGLHLGFYLKSVLHLAIFLYAKAVRYKALTRQNILYFGAAIYQIGHQKNIRMYVRLRILRIKSGHSMF